MRKLVLTLVALSLTAGIAVAAHERLAANRKADLSPTITADPLGPTWHVAPIPSFDVTDDLF